MTIHYAEHYADADYQSIEDILSDIQWDRAIRNPWIIDTDALVVYLKYRRYSNLYDYTV